VDYENAFERSYTPTNPKRERGTIREKKRRERLRREKKTGNKVPTSSALRGYKQTKKA